MTLNRLKRQIKFSFIQHSILFFTPFSLSFAAFHFFHPPSACFASSLPYFFSNLNFVSFPSSYPLGFTPPFKKVKVYFDIKFTLLKCNTFTSELFNQKNLLLYKSFNFKTYAYATHFTLCIKSCLSHMFSRFLHEQKINCPTEKR
jgi:hypothetical protein